MAELFDIVTGVAQGLTVLFTFAIMCIRPFRAWILGTKDRKSKEAEEAEIRDEAMRCNLRNYVTEFYFSHEKVCEIHQYEYENIAKTYAAYKRMGGNSFVDVLWERMQLWSIIQ